jgi:hypothetical protein
MNEVINRLEAGESTESIEQSIPTLAADADSESSGSSESSLD